MGRRGAGGVDRDLWVDPLVVSYLNIGFHKLERSLSEIAQLILRHRPDVLFLGDIGVARNKIGRLKQRMESSLGTDHFLPKRSEILKYSENFSEILRISQKF